MVLSRSQHWVKKLFGPYPNFDRWVTSDLGRLFTESLNAQRAALDQKTGAIDFEPVVKIFTPDGNATWLPTELDANSHLAFGLCDLGRGEPELAAARGPLGLPLERDLCFASTRTIAAFAELAREHRRIVT